MHTSGLAPSCKDQHACSLYCDILGRRLQGRSHSDALCMPFMQVTGMKLELQSVDLPDKWYSLLTPCVNLLLKSVKVCLSSTFNNVKMLPT